MIKPNEVYHYNRIANFECKLEMSEGELYCPEELHKYFDGGFSGKTQVSMYDGEYKNMENIQSGDVLSNGEKVIGVVKLDGRNMKPHSYILGNDAEIIVWGNIVYKENSNEYRSTISTEKTDVQVTDNKVYHLITDSGEFRIGNTHGVITIHALIFSRNK